MSLRFFSDQCVPAEITDTLRRHRHQVTVLREVLPIRSADSTIIAKAQELNSVLLSLTSLRIRPPIDRAIADFESIDVKS